MGFRALVAAHVVVTIVFYIGLVGNAAWAQSQITGAVSTQTLVTYRNALEVDTNCEAPSNPSPDGENVPYAVIAFHVSASAPVSADIAMIAGGTTITDPVMGLYCQFDPLWPELGLIATDHDSGVGLMPAFSGIPLQPGRTYHLLVAPFSNAYTNLGTFTVELGSGLAAGPAPSGSGGADPLAVGETVGHWRTGMHGAVGLTSLSATRQFLDILASDGRLDQAAGLSFAMEGPAAGVTTVVAASQSVASQRDERLWLVDVMSEQWWIGARASIDPAWRLGLAVGRERFTADAALVGVNAQGHSTMGLAFVDWAAVGGDWAVRLAAGGGTLTARMEDMITGASLGDYDGWRGLAFGSLEARPGALGLPAHWPMRIGLDIAVLADRLDAFTLPGGQTVPADWSIVGSAGGHLAFSQSFTFLGLPIVQEVAAGLRAQGGTGTTSLVFERELSAVTAVGLTDWLTLRVRTGIAGADRSNLSGYGALALQADLYW